MTTQSSAARRTKPPPLVHGEHLDQKTFHARYAAMPSHIRAELIGGIVYMSSPQKLPHGESQNVAGQWLGEYQTHTPGTLAVTNSTSILGDDKEPQPDDCLLLLPECGGQTCRDDDDCLCGAPELIGEVSDATESVDLNAKKRDYERAGVLEYIVVALRKQKVFWFVRRRGKFKEMTPGKDGILRSEVFPGLWLDADALLRRDRMALLAVLREGLASAEHAAFVKKLEQKRGRKK